MTAAAPAALFQAAAPTPATGSTQVASRPDIDLFVEQVGWLGDRVAAPSRLTVMSWLGRMLRPEVRARLSGLFRADHPAQIQAEAAILRLLGRSWQKRAPRYVLLDVPEREVDWPRTHLEELTSPPSRYWARAPTQLLDAELLGALASLGATLLELGSLGAAEEAGARRAAREELRRAIARVNREVGNRHAPYTPRHEQRLLRADEDARRAALAIRAGLAFWRARFGGQGDRAKLREIGEQIHEADLKHRARTLYSLLELSSAISIARAALETREAADLPAGERWTLEDIDDRDSRNVPRIRLRAGALRCCISKEPPPGDTLVPLLQGMGLVAYSNQPDIVMTFSRLDPVGQERSLVVLADAKRNADSDGRGYLARSVDAAIGYAVSFGHRMRLRFHPGGEALIDGDVLPAVTLFCRQGVTKIAGAGPGDAEIIARLRGPAALPAVMALDLEHFFGDAGARAGWRPDILSAWFGRISRQAAAAL